MREIEILRHLLELRARHFFQPGRSSESGCDGLDPATNRADVNFSSRIGGYDRHKEASQDQPSPKRNPTAGTLM